MTAARAMEENCFRPLHRSRFKYDEVADKLDVLIKNVFEGTETVRDSAAMKWDRLGIDPNEVYDLANNQLLLDNVLGGLAKQKHG